MNRLIVCVLSFGLLSIAPCLAQDTSSNWSTWRGPNENGSAAEGANPPVDWSPTKNIKWKVEVPGTGKSTPIVWGNQVIVLSAIKTDRSQAGAAVENLHHFSVFSYDRATGNKQWERVVAEEAPHEKGHQTNSFASSSALTDGKSIYAFFGSRGLFCLDMQGNIKWKKNIGKMSTLLAFGEAATPALFEGTLVVPWDHEGDCFLYAFDAATGNEKWKTPREKIGDRGNTTWATPLIVKHKGRNQVIVNGKIVRSYDLANGKQIWQCGGQASNPIPSPILVGDHVICTTGYQGYAIYSISLDSEGDVTGKSSVAWSTKDAGPYVASPTLYKGQLYLIKDGNIAWSFNAKTGEAIFKNQNLPAIRRGNEGMYSSPVAAADRIYYTGREGTTVVLKHGSNFEILATNSLGETIDSSFALVGNAIFVRGEKNLFCISQG